MKVVVGGPPQSGKSTLTASLIKAIRERQRNRSYQLPFSWQPLDVTDNSIAVLLNTDDAIEQKRDVEWTDERAEERRATFQARDERLVIADAPGRITDQLEIVVGPADAMILLVSHQKRDRFVDWETVASDNGLATFARLTSVLDEDIEVGWNDRARREGVVRLASRSSVERQGVNALGDTTRRMIRQIATDLLQSASRE